MESKFKNDSKFDAVVRSISLPDYPKTIPGRQIHPLFSFSELSVLEELLDLWRNRYKTVNEAHAIAVACKFFLENVKEDEIDEE